MAALASYVSQHAAGKGRSRVGSGRRRSLTLVRLLPLRSLLPTPRYTPASNQPAASSSSSSSAGPAASSSSTALTTTSAPPYGHRSTFRPSSQADFGDGGAYPECPIAQYPLELGRKKTAGNGKTLALQVDQDGNVDYAAIARQGQREGKNVQSSFKGTFPR
jgi:SNW domain-containing protein 1